MYIKPKKRLGQNFLFDKNIQRKIISACAFKPQETVLEIGAGRGEFTKRIASAARQVFALEIDKELYGHLKNELKEFKNITLINEDILKFNLAKKFKNVKSKIIVYGNIPYYISSPIIEHLFKYREKIEKIYLTVQKEFAKRIVAVPGNKIYGSLSCFVQYYSVPEILFDIKKNSFWPAPKVDSSFLKLQIREKPAVRVEDEKKFFEIIRRAFNQRRKTLRSSLKGLIPAERFAQPFCRPEMLSLEDFAALSNH